MNLFDTHYGAPIPRNSHLHKGAGYFYALLLLITVGLFPGYNSFCIAATKSNLDKGADQVRLNIGQLEKNIMSHQGAIETEQKNETTLLHELTLIEQNLAGAQKKLDILDDKVRAQKLKIDAKSSDLSIALAQNSLIQKHLVKRMHAYYTMGHVGFLNVTFSTKSLHELISFREGFDALISYDKKLIATYRQTIDGLERDKIALGREKEILDDFVTQILVEQEQIKKTKNDKKHLLARIHTQKLLHAQAIKEMQASSTKLTANLGKIKKKQDIQNNTFLHAKGHLKPPVDGQIVTHFMEKKPNLMGVIHTSMGIAIKVADGTPIIATGSGEIVFSGYLRDHGNTVIIHHGYQYYSVTSRIEKILKKKGQRVRTGETIGITGDTATLIDEGLYFEIRHDKKSMDPLLWLDPKLIDG